jgi:DNA-binding MarR family transcriptional regulator
MNQKVLALLCSVVKTGRLVEANQDRLLDTVELSNTKMLALQHLLHADEPLSLGDLAERLQVVKSNMTQLVDNLEAAGLVLRVPHGSDRRCKVLALTDEGRRQADAALEAVQPLVKRIAALYTPQEQETFSELLQRLNEALDD